MADLYELIPMPEEPQTAEEHTAEEQLATITQLHNFLETFAQTVTDPREVKLVEDAARAVGRLAVAIENAGDKFETNPAVKGKTNEMLSPLARALAGLGCMVM